MPRIDLPDLPEELYQQLAQRAREKGLSVEDQAVALIRDAIARTQVEEERLLEEIRVAREARRGLYVTEAELKQIKRAGLP